MLGPLEDRYGPQALVSAHEWYRYRSLGEWRLAGRMVAPAFTFEGFEIAPPDWSPPGRNTRLPG